jgi:hypothetical protein
MIEKKSCFIFLENKIQTYSDDKSKYLTILKIINIKMELFIFMLKILNYPWSNYLIIKILVHEFDIKTWRKIFREICGKCKRRFIKMLFHFITLFIYY